MTPSARLSAAIEVFSEIAERRRPAGDALKDWGLAHRFAGSGDRAAIAGLVYDALRRRASSAWIMKDDSARAIMLGMLRRERGLDAAAVARLADGSRFAPEPLAPEEAANLEAADLASAPAWVAGDYPEWLDPQMTQAFGPARAEEGAGLASRAPLDLRVNTLKGDRAEAAAALGDLGARETRWSPVGLRIPLRADARSPGIQAEPAFLKGLVEVQDEGSQLATLFSGARAGERVVDLCAGAGGKTLGLAAMMGGRGELIATDSDKRRLAPSYARFERAGARNVKVRTPRPGADVLADLDGQCDLVFVDAPCTGTGAWRRNPDAKWRMRPGALDIRLGEQNVVLDRAADLVRPGGRIAYVTCSVLDAENGGQVRAFLARRPDFTVRPPADVATDTLGDRAGEFLGAAAISPEGLLMTPRRTDTDGFFVSILVRAGDAPSTETR